MYKLDKTKHRSNLANPYQNTSLHERLIKNKSIDLRDNSYTIDYNNGYSEIKPIDPNKKIK